MNQNFDLNSNIKLKVTNLQKEFGEITILKDINFEVYEGEFLSILGPSGCGKTSLLRILLGLLIPTDGSIELEGQDITDLEPSKRKMGVVFQNYALFENMTVLKNVEYAMKFHDELKENSREIALEIIEKVGLLDSIHKKPNILSGGQQQRVAIARTLALKPDIILFDEPMSALDVETRLALRKEIKHIQGEYGVTMIYVTHDQEEAFSLSDRIMVMGDSRIHQLDTPNNIIRFPKNSYVESFVVDNLKEKIKSIVKYFEN